MKRILTLILTALLITTAFAGGALASDDSAAMPLQDTSTGNPKAEKVAKGANDFAFKLGNELAKSIGNENFVCSPYSVWLPLAALVNATDADNKEALLNALGAAGITESDINNAASRMLYSLTRQSDAEFYAEMGEEFYDSLKLANAVFVDKSVTLKEDFAKTFLDYYRGMATTVDFSSQEAVDTVNQWASDNTEGLITNIVSDFDPQTIAAIANAIYFSDRWEWEFNSSNTKEDVFHSANGNTTAFYMLREGDEQVYYEDDKIQAMPLRFMTGGGLYIILPKDGDANSLMSSMTNEYFTEIRANSSYKTGKLLLPRFSIESDISDALKNALIALGVPLFDPETAALTGGLIEESIQTWISDTVQKAIIEVDEKGTTAAAVTVMAVAGAGMPQPTDPFEMICDKPFMFVLFANTYDGGNQVLFTGVVNKP